MVGEMDGLDECEPSALGTSGRGKPKEGDSPENKGRASAEGGQLISDIDEDTCVICLEHFIDGDRLRVLPCDHSFHVGCIDTYQVPLLMKIASPQVVPLVRSILFLSFTKKRKQFLVAPVLMAAFQAGPSPDLVVFWLIVDLRAKNFVVLDLLVIVIILLAGELSVVLVKGLRLSTLWLII